MKLRHLFAPAFAALTLGLPALTEAASPSGVYVGASADNVELVQIIQTPDGRIAGRIEDVTLSKDGAIQDNSIVVEGAGDGRQITLSPKSILMSGNVPGASGFLDGNLLDLSWQGGHRILQRADAYAFEAAVSVLRERSVQLIADRDARNSAAAKAAAIQNLLQSRQALSDGLSRFAEMAARAKVYLSNADERYATLAEAAQHKHTKQRIFASTSGFGVDAMSAGTDAQAIMGQIDGLHAQVYAMRGEVHLAAEQMRGQISSFELACSGAALQSDGVAAGICGDLTVDKEKLTSVVGPLQGAFDDAEAAFQNGVAHASEREHLIRKLFQ